MSPVTRRTRRRVLALAVISMAGLSWLGVGPAPLQSAQAFCSPEEGCSPCGPMLVIDGKNTRLQPVYC